MEAWFMDIFWVVLAIIIIGGFVYRLIPKGEKLAKLSELVKTCLVVFNIKPRQKPDSFGNFNEEAAYEKGFSEHYQDRLKPLADKYEQKRLAALNTARIFAIISLPVAILAIVFLAYFILSHDLIEFFNIVDTSGGFVAFFGSTLIGKSVLLLFLVSTILVFAFWLISNPFRRYQSEIKTDIFPEILKFLGEFNYRQDGPDYSLFDRFNAFEILPNFDRAFCEDYMQGSYENLPLELFECELQQERSHSNSSTTYITVFKGIIINIGVNKSFQGKTVVRSDHGKLANLLSEAFSKLSKLKRVSLEDPEFEKIFEVYSSDQVEARYLLTTAFMQRLKELVTSFNSDSLQCAFYDKQLLIMIPVKHNLFEPGSVLEAEDFVDDAKSLLKDMQQVFNVIDTLKLDQDIGM